MRASPPAAPKYRQVYEVLCREIQTGQFRPGDRMPSEAELVRRFGASRITVGRAVRDLQSAGLVERRVGSGTYVRGASRRPGAQMFGLLMPDLGETDIFEPIGQGMAGAAAARQHALLWGHPAGAAESKESQAWDLCRQYIDQKVGGVFFAPLELTPNSRDVNERIVRALDTARVPVVLLDRPVRPYPEPSAHDLVGIDNRRAGYIVTEHLLRLGARRVAFVGLPNAASTVDAREAGFFEALRAWGAPADLRLARRIDPADPAQVGELLERERPDAIVCANDRIAGRLMRTLIDLGRSIPGAVRLVGIDDVGYASLLPVPLTTLHQPCREIGVAAMDAMLDRVARPALPPRDIFLHPTLIVRQSCGAASS